MRENTKTVVQLHGSNCELVELKPTSRVYPPSTFLLNLCLQTYAPSRMNGRVQNTLLLCTKNSLKLGQLFTLEVG